MRSILLLTVLVGASAWVVVRQLPQDAHAEAGRARPEKTQEIQSIAIDGRGLPLAALRATLTSKVGDSIDPRRLERDRAALAAELESRGYLAAKVAPAAVSFGQRGGAYIVFDVETGPMFHLRSIVVSGPGRRDAGVVTIAAGDAAIRERLERARQTLVDTLARRRPRPEVELVTRVDRRAAALDVELVTR